MVGYPPALSALGVGTVLVDAEHVDRGSGFGVFIRAFVQGEYARVHPFFGDWLCVVGVDLHGHERWMYDVYSQCTDDTASKIAAVLSCVSPTLAQLRDLFA